MDLQVVSSLDYETQFFGFHPRTFIDGVYNTYYENLFDALTSLSSYLCEVNTDEASPEIIKKNTNDFFQSIVKVLDKHIDIFEMYLYRNVLNIPTNVVLPEDSVHVTNHFTEEEEQKLDAAIDELSQQIIKERVKKEVLKSTIANQKKVKAEMSNILETIEDLSSIIHKNHLTKEDLNAAEKTCMEICNEIKQIQELKKPSL